MPPKRRRNKPRPKEPRPWREVFAKSGADKDLCYVRGTKELHYSAGGYGGDGFHEDWDAILEWCEANVPWGQSYENAAFMISVVTYGSHYPFLDGGVESDGGNSFDPPIRRGGYVKGRNALRLMCDVLGLVQPRRTPEEAIKGAIPSREELLAGLREDSRNKSLASPP